MNNDDNNIELPKRIDEVPNNAEPNNITNEISQTNPSETVNETEVTNQIPLEEIPVSEQQVEQPPLQLEPEVQNVFDQPEIKPEINDSPFEPIPNLDNLPEEINNIPDQINETPEAVTPVINENQLADNIVNFETPAPEQVPENTEPLDKKVVVEEPIKKEKGKGNPIIGFLVLLLILAIILAAFYYFVKIDFIKIPDEIKNKIPFLNNITNVTTKVAKKDNKEDISGEYLELESVICPDVRVELKLNVDKTFSYTQLTYKETENKCESTEITGNYITQNGKLKLINSKDLENVITGTYKKTPVTYEITIPIENSKAIILYGKGE